MNICVYICVNIFTYIYSHVFVRYHLFIHKSDIHFDDPPNKMIKEIFCEDGSVVYYLKTNSHHLYIYVYIYLKYIYIYILKCFIIHLYAVLIFLLMINLMGSFSRKMILFGPPEV
jgi:hypothetical protein